MAREPLTPAQLSRRNERLRLVAFLLKGGRLQKEDLPNGEVAWVRASRSGHAFRDALVKRVMSKGAVVEGTKYTLVEYPGGKIGFFQE